MKLLGRVAIVTGASSGIGRGIALALAREGASVIVADVQEAPRRGKYHEVDTVSPTVAEIEAAGGRAAFVEADVSQEAEVSRMIQTAIEEFGGLDILVNNAGVYVH